MITKVFYGLGIAAAMLALPAGAQASAVVQPNVALGNVLALSGDVQAPFVKVQQRRGDQRFKKQRAQQEKDRRNRTRRLVGPFSDDDFAALRGTQEGGGIRKVLPYRPYRFYAPGGG